MPLINEAITKAQTRLQNIFKYNQDDISEETIGEGAESYRFLNEKALIDSYVKEIDFITNEVLNISKLIKSKRSSSLPISSFAQSASLIQETSSDVSTFESYENTFMRLLGMPSFSHIDQKTKDQNSVYIQSSERLKYLDPNSDMTSLSEASFEEIFNVILNERNKRLEDRFYPITDDFFNYSENNEDEYVNSSESKEKSLNIVFYEKQLLYFSYLLFPPIQDANISSIISDVDKIIAPPFLPNRQRKVNDVTLKSSLLESIIRIRLDRLSGSDIEEDEYSIDSDSFGILESLFILRVSTALSALALKFDKERDILFENIEKIRKSQSDQDTGTNSIDQNIVVGDGATDLSDKEKKINNLNLSLNVENGIFSLLGDDSEVLDLQSQTQRSSSIFDSDLLSGIINISDIPRKRILKEIKELQDGIKKHESTITDPSKDIVTDIIGLDIGVGTVDILAFMLALLTMPERSLIGLLTEKQLNDLKTNELSYLIPENYEKENVVASLNILTEHVFDAYKFFQNACLSGQEK